MPEPFGVTIQHVNVPTDPPLTVVQVDLEGPIGTWRESFPTAGHCDAFVRGLMAASSLLGKELPHANITHTV